ncbi:MAG TPA: hypothetical protein VHF89_07065 [Solirubrobacteraceae bacterium]|nr:hypothetical protein [Solirubrobacteraceae bacterium]
MHRWPLLILALLVCAFAATACGDDDVDVDQVLQQTFGEDKNIKSGTLDVSARVEARGLAALSGPVVAELRGPFASTGPTELPRFDFDARIEFGGEELKAGATSTGENGFLSWQGRDYALGKERYEQFKAGYAEQARKSQGDDEGVSFKSLGIDPRAWLRDATYDGKEEVGGADTLHIKADLDVPRLLDDVNRILARAPELQGQEARELTEQERTAIADAIRNARVELWTGEEDKILRRFNVRLDFDIPEQAREQVQGLTGGSVRFDLGLGEINEAQEFPEPESPGTFEDFLAAVVPGAAATGGGSGGTPAPEPAPGGEGGGSAYDECVEEAGADIAKLQECAQLAGG